MRLRPALALAAALWAAGALAAAAEEGRESGGQRIYRWIDENGIAHYTTDPARIPAPLRERIGNPKALSQKPLEARAPDSWADLDAAARAEDAAAEGGGEPEDGRAEAEVLGGAREESELRSETRGSELNGGALRNGRGNGRGLKMRGGANIAPGFATGAAFAAGAAFAISATGGIRLAGAGAESAVQKKRGRLAELDARIAELEARIAAEEEAIKSRISAPDTAHAAAGGDGDGDTGGEALLARAARLPGWLAELRALREERAALSDGG